MKKPGHPRRIVSGVAKMATWGVLLAFVHAAFACSFEELLPAHHEHAEGCSAHQSHAHPDTKSPPDRDGDDNEPADHHAHDKDSPDCCSAPKALPPPPTATLYKPAHGWVGHLDQDNLRADDISAHRNQGAVYEHGPPARIAPI